ncbi:hypothetical protein GCM10009741_63450 [Kribbella lupini]|uniref:Uncharacterized protein n=1 Tax=Kribbella lupini TaxID=291602 RepID=A0ABN2C433_9ACTN
MLLSQYEFWLPSPALVAGYSPSWLLADRVFGSTAAGAAAAVGAVGAVTVAEAMAGVAPARIRAAESRPLISRLRGWLRFMDVLRSGRGTAV